MRLDKLYISKDERDAEYKRLKAEGVKNLKRYTTGPQLIHPQYIEDYPRTLSPEECGFGNTLYETEFSYLYGVKVIPS